MLANSEPLRGFFKLVENLGQNTKENGPNFNPDFDLAITFKPLLFFSFPFSWLTYIFPDLSIDTNNYYICGHFFSFYDGHLCHFDHFGHNGLIQYGLEYGHHGCLWKHQEKCRSPMKAELKKRQRFKRYCQIKIGIENRAIFLCIFPQIFNELEGPLRMLRIS